MTMTKDKAYAPLMCELLKGGFELEDMSLTKTTLVAGDDVDIDYWEENLEDGDTDQMRMVLEHEEHTPSKLAEIDDFAVDLMRDEDQEGFELMMGLRSTVENLVIDNEPGGSLLATQELFKRALNQQRQLLRDGKTFQLFLDFVDTSSTLLVVDGTPIGMLRSVKVGADADWEGTKLEVSYPAQEHAPVHTELRAFRTTKTHMHTDGDNMLLELHGEFITEDDDEDNEEETG